MDTDQPDTSSNEVEENAPSSELERVWEDLKTRLHLQEPEVSSSPRPLRDSLNLLGCVLTYVGLPLGWLLCLFASEWMGALTVGVLFVTIQVELIAINYRNFARERAGAERKIEQY